MTRLGRRVSRLPLRVRLVAGFSATMLLVLGGAGGFVYWRIQHALDQDINTELSTTARVLSPLIRRSGELSDDSALRATDDLYQVLDRSGRVVSGDSPDTPLISAKAARSAAQASVRLDIGDFLPRSSRPLRVLAVPLRFSSGSAPSVLVVAARRDQRDETLRELLGQLALAGAAALVITAFVGDRLAKAALRPVEKYRSQAVGIAAGASGVRLEVPPGREDEITRLGHSLNHVLDALEQALEHERRFVNDASHELRTPLTLLSSRVQLALRRPRSSDEHEEILAEIATDIERLSNLAEQLLTISTELATGDEHDSADLAAVARKEVELRYSLAPPGSVYAAAGALSVSTDGVATVSLSAIRLGQIVGNLLDNAATHGRPPVSIGVDSSDDAWVRMTITDAGAGMDPTSLTTASQRFSRSPTARSRPGSGLGLALVESIVTTADGQLRLCSGQVHHRIGSPVDLPCEHGQAMTVTVLLPVATRLSEAQQADTEAGSVR